MSTLLWLYEIVSLDVEWCGSGGCSPDKVTISIIAHYSVTSGVVLNR